MGPTHFPSASILPAIMAILTIMASAGRLFSDELSRNPTLATWAWDGNDLLPLLVAIPLVVAALLLLCKHPPCGHVLGAILMVKAPTSALALTAISVSADKAPVPAAWELAPSIVGSSRRRQSDYFRTPAGDYAIRRTKTLLGGRMRAGRPASSAADWRDECRRYAFGRSPRNNLLSNLAGRRRSDIHHVPPAHGTHGGGLLKADVMNAAPTTREKETHPGRHPGLNL